MLVEVVIVGPVVNVFGSSMVPSFVMSDEDLE